MKYKQYIDFVEFASSLLRMFFISTFIGYSLDDFINFGYLTTNNDPFIEKEELLSIGEILSHINAVAIVFMYTVKGLYIMGIWYLLSELGKKVINALKTKMKQR